MPAPRGAAAGRRRWRAGCAACAGRRSAGWRRPGRRRSRAPARRRRPRRSPAQVGLARRGELGEAPAKAAVVGVDEQLLAGLGVLHDQQAEVGQRHFHRVVQPHRDDVVPLREVGERLFPARRADEVGDDEHQRAPRRDAVRGLEEVGELRLDGRARRRFRPRRHLLHQVQHVAAAAARRHHGVDAVAVEQRADAVAVAREDAREHGDELGGDRALLLRLRAEVDRRRQVDQEPRGDLALLVVLAHVRRLQARGDVPVDVADVVAPDVLAQVGEVEPVAAEERPVVAVQHAVETADHRPLEPAQDGLRRGGRRGHGFRAACRGAARAA